MMIKVLFVDEFGHQEVVDMKAAPRVGDTIPLFYKPFPRVDGISWLPEKLDDAFKGMGLDLVVAVK